jgi:hypothetical protein
VIVRAELAAFLHQGVAIVVATRDDEGRPEVSRGWGPRVGDDGTEVTLCVAAAPGCEITGPPPTLDDLP